MNQPVVFNRVTQPNYYQNMPSYGREYRNVRDEYIPDKFTQPVSDSRYPAYAGMTEDARFVTDYRPHCTQNTPAGTQFFTKKWMVNHAGEIMDISRKRQSEWTGASLPMAHTVPPPAVIVHSTPFDNELQPSGAPFGIGVERADAKAPVLFGTFNIKPSREELKNNTKKIALTSRYEGGRNSLRGGAVKFTPSLEHVVR